MNNKFFNVAKKDNTLTMTLYSEIGEGMFGDGITPQQVTEALNADNYSDITLRLNSPGGDAFAGVAIYNILKACAKPINVIVDGMAASAASLIAMAGDTITMNSGSVMMIHNAMGMAIGDSNDMLKMADTLSKVTDSLADIYVGKTGLPKKEILDLMDEETWMNADEAVSNKFATAVGQDAAVKNSFDLSMFKHVPESIKNAVKTKDVDGEHLTAEDFIYAGNPHDVSTWSLPWHFSIEEKTKSHLRDALARFDQDEVIPESHKPEAYAKLVRLCKQHGIEVSESDKGNVKDDADGDEDESVVNYNKLDIYARQLEINKRK